MKLLVTKNFSDEKMKMLEDLGYTIVFHDDRCLENTSEINEVDVAYVYHNTDRLDYTQMKNLKMLQLASVGFDHIPKDYFVEKGIILSNNKGGYSIPMAEFIVMSILEVYKNKKQFFKKQEGKRWKMDFSLLELNGKKAGILGTGDIGIETAKRLKAFGVEVWGLNTSGREVENFDRCLPSDKIDELLSECDIVIGLMPSTKSTQGLMNADKFEIMKDGSVLVNAGRGSLINLSDLEKYAEKFRGIVLDVFEEEPLSSESKLWEIDNVLITPHNSWVSDGNEERLFENVYKNLKSFIETGKPERKVEIKKGY